jgi:two-component system response regulator GlrR
MNYKTLSEALTVYEKQIIEELLRTTEGCVSAAAKLAGRHRTSFYLLLKKHGISPLDYRVD